MRAEIISVGTELLLGDIVNTNAQFLAQELASLGFEVYYQTVVGDNAGRLRRLVSEAKDRSDVLVFTGGLGPTDDDLTKQTVAEAFGDVLVMSEEWLAHLEDMFNRRGRQMSDNNRKQALVPRRGGMLFNDNGTAPGVYFKLAGKYAFLLPGPPREMMPMFREHVVPILETLQDSTIRSITLRVAGIGESDLENRVRQLLENSNPTAALYAKTAEVHIRITAKGPTAEMADLMCDEYAQMFRENLGDLIYAEGDESLEETVVRLLAEKGRSVATAESCTGGLLGERITSVPGASAVYGFGAITYANEAKQEMLGVRGGTLRKHGAVSSQVAAEMAFGAAKKGLADYGVGITGVAGPDGGSEQKPVGLVYVALAAGREVFIRRLKMRTMGRAFVRSYAAQVALDMIRRKAAGMPLPEAKRFAKSQQADFERVGKPRRRGGALSRAILAVVLVLAVLAAALFGLYATRQAPDDSGTNIASSYAALQGLRYGSAEYTTAACGLVAQAASANPSVVGFVALPNRLVEATVAQAHFSGQGALDTAAREAGIDRQVVMGSDAAPAQPGANTVLLGGEEFEALLEFRSGEDASELSTFTYYTERQARVYRVFAFYLADDGEARGDGFDPIVATVSSYSDFYAYMLGAKTRSIYDIAIPLAQGDSFMTLEVNDPTAEGRRAYLVGRLARASETVDPTTSFAATAGTPLMPAAWYTQYDLAAPDETALFAATMRGLMTAGATNPALQYATGMPAVDAYPVIQLPLETVDNVQPPASTASSSSSAAASSSGSSGSSASGSDSSGSASSSNSSDSDSSDGDSTSSSASDSDDESGSSSSSAPISIPSSASIAPTPITPIAPTPQPQRPSPHRITVTMNGEVVTDSALNILAQICQAEAANLEPAAIRAVAVAAHSWILCQQGAGIEAPRVVGSAPSPAVLNAVREVAGVVLSADGENPAFTPFYRLAATATNTPENLWGGTRAYLVSVDAPYEQAQEDWRQIITLAPERLAGLVLQNTGIDLATTGEPQSWITEVIPASGGYVSSLVLGGQTVTGANFWADILTEDGVPLLPSPAFEASYDGANFVFITYGDGHGCGLSVTGASGHARNGWGHERILAHYFPGTELLAWE